MRRQENWRSVAMFAFACLTVIAGAQGTLERNRPALKDDQVSLAYSLVWGAGAGFGPFTPVRLEIDNPLKDDKGVVTISGESYTMRYPVELPAKSLRSFVVYVPGNDYSEPKIELDCDQAHLSTHLSSSFGGSTEDVSVGLVSDSTSLLTFLRALSTKRKTMYGDEQEVQVRDFATLPQYAPDRSIGYQGLDMVVLGEGAERLADDQVHAIQNYVLMGGHLLLTGGAVTPILQDPRWAAFAPGRFDGITNIQGSRIVSTAGGSRLSGTLTVAKITPDAGTTGVAEGGVPIFWYKRCGLGMCVFWAFDPFQAPVRTYTGRTRLFLDTLNQFGDSAQTYIDDLGVDTNQYDEYYGSYPVSISSRGYPGGGVPQNSVFKTHAPPAGTVFLILGAYFVVVVPLNFLILGRLGRGQLAWVTSPLIGIAFASIFFYAARGLYGSALSRSTDALIVAHQGSPEAYAVGRQQLFFPSGGRYDLKFSGVEAVTSGSNDYNPFSQDRGSSLREDLVDVGEVIAPSAGVSNLAFRQIGFRQTVPWPYRTPLKLTVTKVGKTYRAKGVFTNDTPYTLAEVVIWAGQSSISLGQVKSGSTVDVDGLVVKNRAGSAARVPVSAGQVVLTALVEGVPLGARVGKEEKLDQNLYISFDDVSSKVVGE